MANAYKVLARKYRPQSFDTLLGHEEMVKTLENSMAAGRMAHAFILTGVRGVGKTTTARLLAKGFNCLGQDGKGQETMVPCGVCASCVAFNEDKSLDIIEIDAASRTGVDDMREILDNIVYKPTHGRYKIYIIDEVHMLSKSAFNALLKTLEEPPAHVKFIFATTEIHKVPVTILSRCQRFDLKRLTPHQLSGYFHTLMEKERIQAEDAAIDLIAEAADGSVRDGLSLLDQSINLGNGQVQADITRTMLGKVDSAAIEGLLQAICKGDIQTALNQAQAAYQQGGHPGDVLESLLHIVHELTLQKVGGQAHTKNDLLGTVSLPTLNRLWQVMLKGMEDIKKAPNAQAALEMVLVRLCYTADAPDIDQLIQLFKAEATVEKPTPALPGATISSQYPQVPQEKLMDQPVTTTLTPHAIVSEKGVVRNPAPKGQEAPQTWADVIALFENHQELILASRLEQDVPVVTYAPGHLIHGKGYALPTDVATPLKKQYKAWTGEPLKLEAHPTEEGMTAAARAHHENAQALKSAAEAPNVKAVLDAFPGSKVVAVE